MNVTITLIGAYHPAVMPTAGRYDISGQVRIDDTTYRFEAEKFDTENYSDGVTLKLYEIGSDDEVIREIDWEDGEDNDDAVEEWEEIQERMTELLDEFDNFAYGQMKEAWTRAVADYNASVGAP